MNTVTLKELLQELAAQRSFDLRGYKISSLERRFKHRMFELKIGTYAEYADYIRRQHDEVTYLLASVLINVTEFFRDPPAWEVLRNDVLPSLTASLKPGQSLRAWSAGCASGEEAYSLAILLAEHLGDKIKDLDVRVYATDIDEEALNVARRGEYAAEKLRQIRPEWRAKYFTGEKICRVTRDLRRLLIFGRSNLASDAPISRVQLLLCRNVLIYFDSDLQKQVLTRLHYALDPGGYLMLGKSESQLGQSSLFARVNPKWRIFRRVEPGGREGREPSFLRPHEEDQLARAKQDYSQLKIHHQTLLETLEPGVLVLDRRGVIVNDNKAVDRLWGLGEEKLVGRRLSSTSLVQKCPDLLIRLESLKKGGTTNFECSAAGDGGDQRQLSVTLRPVASPNGDVDGMLVYMEDVSPRHKLQHTIQELENTGVEMQSANEELETTNEELQSTNEELETTNEELQSTNEELETTNEELQALNEELRTTNEELEVRTKQLDEVNLRYSDTLDGMPWPLMLVTQEGIVQFWNSAAERLFGLPSKSVVGLRVKQLPFPEELRNRLARAHHASLLHTRPSWVRGLDVQMDVFRGKLDLQLTALEEGEHERTVIVTFLVAPEARKLPAHRDAAGAGAKAKSNKKRRSKSRQNHTRKKPRK